MLRVLSAIGAFPEPEGRLAAKHLYDQGHYASQLYYVSLMCFGRESDPDVAERYPHVPQILWPEVLAFIYRRFRNYRNQKASHPQWEQTGQDLWTASERSRDESMFQECIRVL
jgi:hypothetical protein